MIGFRTVTRTMFCVRRIQMAGGQSESSGHRASAKRLLSSFTRGLGEIAMPEESGLASTSVESMRLKAMPGSCYEKIFNLCCNSDIYLS